MEFFLLIFLLGFAFSGNAKNAVFDCYPNVILFHFRQVSFEQIPLIILTDINSGDQSATARLWISPLPILLGKPPKKIRFERFCASFHLSKRIPCCYFI